jgi:hypothetical protein
VSADDLQVDFKALTSELDKLNELSRKIGFESGLDASNPQEGIWKTPSMGREMHERLHGLAQGMDAEIANLQESLRKALENIIKEQP